MNTDRISKLQRRAIDLRGKLEEIGPVIFGTIAKKTQKCHHKDGSVRICPSPSVMTFAKTRGRGQARIPREAEKNAAGSRGRPRPVRTGCRIEGRRNSSGGDPLTAGARRGAGKKNGKVKNSAPIA